VNQEYQAQGDANWFYVDQEYRASSKIFWVNQEYQADVKVFFVTQQYQAKWRKANKYQNRL